MEWYNMWLLLLSIMFLSFIHVVTWMSSSFLLLNSIPIRFTFGRKHTTTTWKPNMVVVLQLSFQSGMSQYCTRQLRRGGPAVLIHSLYHLNVFWRERDWITFVDQEVFDSYFHGCLKDLIPLMVERVALFLETQQCSHHPWYFPWEKC